MSQRVGAAELQRRATNGVDAVQLLNPEVGQVVYDVSGKQLVESVEGDLRRTGGRAAK